MLLRKEELKRDYYQLGLTQQEIADKHGCCRKTVQRRMDEYELERTSTLNRYVNKDGRVYYRSGNNKIAEYQLVAIADGADPEEVFNENHVHHINGCVHDNRAENLIVLTPEQHALVEQEQVKIDQEKGIIYRVLDEI